MVVIEAVAIVALAVAVAALFRTQAKLVAVLRAGSGIPRHPERAETTPRPERAETTARPATATPAPARLPAPGDPAPAVVGVDPAGNRASWEPTDGAVIAFLTGECLPCRWWWEQLAGPAGRLVPDVVVVTPDPSTDDPVAVARLAGDDLRVIMASAAWETYGVAGAGTFVAVADGRVSAAGPAEGWDDLVTLMAGAGVR